MPVIGIEKLIEFFLQNFLREGETILDVGSGNGFAAKLFSSKCIATAIDMNFFCCKGIKSAIMNFMNYKPSRPFDAIWCSHVLEHMPNLNKSIKKILSFAKENASIGFVVPPRKDALVGGHLNLFTAGSLCYNVILAGQDLSKAACIIYEYNISIFWHKKQAVLPKLKMNVGDIEVLNDFFPKKVYQGIDGMREWDRINVDNF